MIEFFEKRIGEIGAFSDYYIHLALGKDVFYTCLDSTSGANRNIIVSHQKAVCKLSTVMMISVLLEVLGEKI